MNREAVPPRAPHPVDVYVGQQVRQRRILVGMSQQALSDRLGVTFQQLQKYENGSNRISASRLHQLSRLLHVSIAYFFDGYSPGWTCDQNGEMGQRETLVLVRSYYRIKDEEVRRHLRELIDSLGGVVSRGTVNKGETDGGSSTTADEQNNGE